MSRRALTKVAVYLGILLFLVFIWPTPYREVVSRGLRYSVSRLDYALGYGYSGKSVENGELLSLGFAFLCGVPVGFILGRVKREPEGRKEMKRKREVVWRGDRGEGTIFFFVDTETGEKVSPHLYAFYRAGGKEHTVSTRSDATWRTPSAS